MLHRWGFPLRISVPSPSPQISKSPIHSSSGQLVMLSRPVSRDPGTESGIEDPGRHGRLRVPIRNYNWPLGELNISLIGTACGGIVEDRQLTSVKVDK